MRAHATIFMNRHSPGHGAGRATHRRDTTNNPTIDGQKTTMNPTRRAMLACAGALAVAGAAPRTWARDAFPSRPMRIIVPVSPGGSNDLAARLLAPSLSQALGQPVVVENKAGAGGAIGSALVARAEPDGYTALLYSNSILTLPALMKNPGFQVQRDLIPVSMLVKSGAVLVVGNGVPARTLPELLAYIRKQGSAINYGSGGIGGSTHLMGEMFNKMAGTNMTHVPFKSAGEYNQAIIANQVQLAFDVLSSAKPLADSGRLRILAVTGKERDPALPQVSTLDEGGLHGYEYLIWQGLFLPARTPQDIVMKWAAACRQAVDTPEVRQKFASSGVETVGSTPEEFARVVQRDAPVLAKLVEQAGIARQ
ncbi:tripartite tricarboxylate transporter family receptor [Bordetella bronchiseptica MO211]|nr:tripartite tricarboxylate transporter family receptor [Bordetella bronchiseptica MO211]